MKHRYKNTLGNCNSIQEVIDTIKRMSILLINIKVDKSCNIKTYKRLDKISNFLISIKIDLEKQIHIKGLIQEVNLINDS